MKRIFDKNQCPEIGGSPAVFSLCFFFSKIRLRGSCAVLLVQASITVQASKVLIGQIRLGSNPTQKDGQQIGGLSLCFAALYLGIENKELSTSELLRVLLGLIESFAGYDEPAVSST